LAGSACAAYPINLDRLKPLSKLRGGHLFATNQRLALKLPVKSAG
jgi:hypothetical protein